MYLKFKKILDGAREAWDRREARNALHGLSNHMLKDIGLHRSEIGSALNNRER